MHVCICIWYILVCAYMCVWKRVCKLAELKFKTTFAKVRHLVVLSEV